MTKQIYRNITRVTFPVMLKTVDGRTTFSIMAYPNKEFTIFDTQVTPDIEIKLANKIFILVSEINEPAATTTVITTPKLSPVVPVVKAEPKNQVVEKDYTQSKKTRREVKIATKDNT